MREDPIGILMLDQIGDKSVSIGQVRKSRFSAIMSSNVPTWLLLSKMEKLSISMNHILRSWVASEF